MDSLLYYRRHEDTVSDNSKIQQSGSPLIRKLALAELKFPESSINFHLNFYSGRYNSLALEYWPVYLTDLKDLGENYYNIGVVRFKAFCKALLSAEQAEQFVDCVRGLKSNGTKTYARG